MKRISILTLIFLLSACASPPKPPEPYGFKVPINKPQQDQTSDRKPVATSEPSTATTAE